MTDITQGIIQQPLKSLFYQECISFNDWLTFYINRYQDPSVDLDIGLGLIAYQIGIVNPE
jgi:hypothetical protein